MRTSCKKKRADVTSMCKQPLGYLNSVSCHRDEPSLLQVLHPVGILCSMSLHGCCPCSSSVKEQDSQNFAEMLPTEMSVRIFGELDAESLCNASRTCRLWHHIIEQSEQLWRQQCLLVRAICQREVDRDRRDGLSWKVTLVRNFTRSRVKTDWLRGRYSSVRSADELGRSMTPLDVETWGELLQAELDR